MLSKYTTPAPERSVLLTIDVQRGFTDAGALAEIPGTRAAVPAMRRAVHGYRERGLPIVHVVRLYLPGGTNVDICRREMVEGGKAVVLPGTQGAELADLLKPDPDARLDARMLLAGELQILGKNEWAMYKPRWDAFYGTPLEKHLQDLAITTVVVVGCNFPNCPRATIYGASMRDFRTVLITDAVSGVYDRGLRELGGIAVATPTSAEYLGWLENPFQPELQLGSK